MKVAHREFYVLEEDEGSGCLPEEVDRVRRRRDGDEIVLVPDQHRAVAAEELQNVAYVGRRSYELQVLEHVVDLCVQRVVLLANVADMCSK